MCFTRLMNSVESKERAYSRVSKSNRTASPGTKLFWSDQLAGRRWYDTFKKCSIGALSTTSSEYCLSAERTNELVGRRLDQPLNYGYRRGRPDDTNH